MRGWFLARVLLIIAFTSGLVPAQVTTVPFSPERPIIADPLTDGILASLGEAELGPKTRLAVHVVNTGTGVSIVDLNADEVFTPASLIKLVTASAALDVLGPDHRFETKLEINGSLEKGTLYGDVIIRGGGDPSLAARFLPPPADPGVVTQEWAKQIRKLGIQSILGNVTGDDRRYAFDPHALGWEPMEFAEWYSAEVSALNFNENVVDIAWTAGSQPEDPVKYVLMPETKYITFNHGVRTGPRSLTRERVRYYRFADSNELRARGRIPIGSKVYDFAAIHDPARYVAFLLMEELERQGVKVQGAAMPARELGDRVPMEETRVIDTKVSPPLSEFMPVVLGESQNLYAEVLLREVAHASGKPTTSRDSARCATEWLISKGLHRNGFLMVDGSGLSPVDRMSARLASGLLLYQHRGPNSDLFKASLAQPGQGSLRERFTSVEFGGLRTSLRAKTGYLGGTHSLAGYFTTPSGKEYAFTILLNDYDPRKSEHARDFVDGLVLKLHESEFLQ